MTYPAIIPSERSVLALGEYPNTAHVSLSGRESRVSHSNVMIGAQVQLFYKALEEAQFLELLNHYNSVKGYFRSFALPAEVWSGNDNPNDFTLPGDAWKYAREPDVEEVFYGDGVNATGVGYNISIFLESVPGEGVGVLGPRFTMTPRFTPGRAAASNGPTFQITPRLVFGEGRAPGFSIEMSHEFIPGTTTGGIGAITQPRFFINQPRFVAGRATSLTGLAILLAPAFSPGIAYVTQDATFGDVELLLHGWDGLVDASLNNRTITAGTAISITADARFGNEAILFSQNQHSWLEIDEVILTGNCTVEAWFQLEVQPPDASLTTTRQTLLAGFNGGAFNGVTFYTSQGAIYLTVHYSQGGAGSLTTSTSGIIELGKLHFFRFTHTNGANRIFIDGVLRATSSGAESSPFSFVTALIGASDKLSADNDRYSGPLAGLRLTNVSRATTEFPLPVQSWPDTTNRIQAGVPSVDTTATPVFLPGAASTG